MSIRRGPSPVLLLFLLPSVASALAGCSAGGGPTPERCASGRDCDADGGVAADAQGWREGGPREAGAPDCDAGDACGGACCAVGELCRFDTCVADLGPCETHDDCGSDSYCAGGSCVPYGVPADHDRNAECTRQIDLEALVPEVQCRWTGPPAGDAAPAHVQVMSTPVVVDLGLERDEDPDADPILRPSIIFTSFPTEGSYAEPGVLRVIDGSSCAQQLSFSDAEDAVTSPASVAAGDLEGDGRVEIVAPAFGTGLIAFGTRDDETFGRLWRSGQCDGAGGRAPDGIGGNFWNGPSIHDLDDDGVAEILYGGAVYDADGCLRSASLGFPDYSQGLNTVVADVDEDGEMEIVFGNGIHRWDAAAGDVVAEEYFAGEALPHGAVAVADLGTYPLASFGGEDRAEVAVVSAGRVHVQTIEGTVIFGPFDIPGGGTGGPPTIADFDGDGRAELATAGGDRYAVFDLDCVDGGDPAGCRGESRTDGVLWSQPSQDHSSNITGSSVFDFDADGRAEAVYADECFLRIYDGATGEVRYSAARMSGTTYENPVIADVDGDFHTEIVSSVNDYSSSLGCPAADPLRPDTTFERGHGIVVLRDAEDRWAASRPVWNQHAYAVTHVGDRGEIPRTSEVAINWRDQSLNNFRQNVQGDLEALGVPDLTSSAAQVDCTGGAAELGARICNRGTLPIGAGTDVSFRAGGPHGSELCRAELPGGLGPGSCSTVQCEATVPDTPVDVYVVPDPDAGVTECHEGNNGTVLEDVACAFG